MIVYLLDIINPNHLFVTRFKDLLNRYPSIDVRVKRGDYRCGEAGLSTEPGRIRRSRRIRPDCLPLTRRFRHHLLQRMRNRNKAKSGGHHRRRAKS